MNDSGALWGYDWEEAEDIISLSEEGLRERLHELVEEEKTLSYRRRILQGRIDLIRAELTGRGVVTLAPEELAKVLLGRAPGPSPGRSPRLPPWEQL